MYVPPFQRGHKQSLLSPDSSAAFVSCELRPYWKTFVFSWLNEWKKMLRFRRQRVFSLKRDVAVDDSRLSFVSVFHLCSGSLPAPQPAQTKHEDGGDSHNSSADSLPPEEEVEQDLACLLPRKPKVKCLHGEVLHSDQRPPGAVSDAKQAIRSYYCYAFFLFWWYCTQTSLIRVLCWS